MLKKSKAQHKKSLNHDHDDQSRIEKTAVKAHRSGMSLKDDQSKIEINAVKPEDSAAFLEHISLEENQEIEFLATQALSLKEDEQLDEQVDEPHENHRIRHGTLWIVAVPIGNLEDITLRALRILKSVSLIACEDTRTTKQLLQRLGIQAPQLVACHDHNEDQQIERLCQHLWNGQDMALVSDAGTPTLSDPGFKVVRGISAQGLKVVPIPGACAAITALCASGLPTNQFEFIGFLSAKDQARRKQLERYVDGKNTLIFYESPHRLLDFLKDAVAVFGADREAVIARELTKKFEEFRRGSLGYHLQNPGIIRGEIVVLIAGEPQTKPAQALSTQDITSLARHAINQGMTPTEAAKWLSKEVDLNRKEAYALILSVIEHKK